MLQGCVWVWFGAKALVTLDKSAVQFLDEEEV